jgi:hypothetical protein
LLAINCCPDVPFEQGNKAIRAVSEVAMFSVPWVRLGRRESIERRLIWGQVGACKSGTANPASLDVKRLAKALKMWSQR